MISRIFFYSIEEVRSNIEDLKKDQTKGFIGAAKQSDMIIQGFLGANSLKNDLTENVEKDNSKIQEYIAKNISSSDSIRKGMYTIFFC